MSAPPPAIILYCDGGCWPNPGGLATWGFMAETWTGEYVGHGSGVIEPSPSTSSNVAEYTALIEALEWIIKRNEQDFQVRMDSQLIVRQVRGIWGCNADHLKPLLAEAKRLLEASGPYATIRWIPREENESADALTREARDRYKQEKYGREPESQGMTHRR